MKVPNVVLLVLDDLGYADVGFTQNYALEKMHGSKWESEKLPEVKTPNIDALASEGVTFSSGYVSGQICSPTRAGLMLGSYQQGVGIYHPGVGGFGMEVLKYDGKDYNMVNPWIPQFLQQTGTDADYVTGAFGKWHLGLDEALRANDTGIYHHINGDEPGRGQSRESMVYGKNNDGDFIVYPEIGPIVERDGFTPITAGLPDIFESIAPNNQAGSPYHPLYRGFDSNHIFMGRGAHSYWDPNDIYVSKDPLNPSLGKISGRDHRVNPDKTRSEPVKSWNATATPYKIHKERIPSNYLTNNITDAAVNFIKRSVGGEKPFMAYVPYNTPHFPLQAPYHMDPTTGELDRLGNDKRRYAGMSRNDFLNSGIEDKWFSHDYDGDWFPDPLFVYETYKDQPNGLKDFFGGGNTPEDDKRRTRAITTSMVRWVDKGIGQIVAALKDPNGDGDTSDSVYEDTMIFLISDNGGAKIMCASNKPLHGGKSQIWEGGYRVPFFMAWDRFLSNMNGEDKRGTLLDEPVIALDILPTILDANGINDPSENPLLASYPSDGKSLLPLISGEVSKLHDLLFWAKEKTKSKGVILVDGAVRKNEWKLIISNNETTVPYRLYNLEEDLGEKKNLIDQYPALVVELKQAYVRFMNDMAQRNGEKVPNRRLPKDLKNMPPPPTKSPTHAPAKVPAPIMATPSATPSTAPSATSSTSSSSNATPSISSAPSESAIPSSAPSANSSAQPSAVPKKSPTNYSLEIELET